MKVPLVTLLIVGFAAAISCPVLEKLKTQLQKNSADVKTHIQEVIDECTINSKEALPLFIRNPVKGSGNLVSNLSKSARKVVQNSIDDVSNIKNNVESAIAELKKLDPKLVKNQVYTILNDLVQTLIKDVKTARESVLQHMKRIIPEVAADANTLLLKPSSGSLIEEKWNRQFQKLFSDGKSFSEKIDKQIQDALKEIENLYPPSPKQIVQKLRINLQQNVDGVRSNIDSLLSKSADNDKNKVDVFIQNPQEGSGPLVNDLFNDARDVLLASYSDIEKMSQNIRTATNDLKKVEPASPLSTDLDSLLKKLLEIRTTAKVNVISNLDHAVTQVATDMVDLQSPTADPKAAKDKWNAHFDEFVVALRQYVSNIDTTVQNTLNALDKKVAV